MSCTWRNKNRRGAWWLSKRLNRRASSRASTLPLCAKSNCYVNLSIPISLNSSTALRHPIRRCASSTNAPIQIWKRFSRTNLYPFHSPIPNNICSRSFQQYRHVTIDGYYIVSGVLSQEDDQVLLLFCAKNSTVVFV